MSLTASNSSRLTISRSRRIFSAWLRTTVSTSRLTPWAAPAASFIRRPISSKNRLLVWVMSTSPAAGCPDNGDPRGFVQGSAGFLGHEGRLSGCGLPAIVIIEPRPQKNRPEQVRHDRPADRYPDQGRQDHNLHQPPGTRRAVPHHHLLHGCARDPRGTARHGAATGDLRLLRDAAEHVLQQRRHGAWTV